MFSTIRPTNNIKKNHKNKKCVEHVSVTGNYDRLTDKPTNRRTEGVIRKLHFQLKKPTTLVCDEVEEGVELVEAEAVVQGLQRTDSFQTTCVKILDESET